MTKTRICKKRGCLTRLSEYNAGAFCFVHTLDLTETDHPETYQTRRPKPRSMSDRFMGNIPEAYHLDPEELARSDEDGYTDAPE